MNQALFMLVIFLANIIQGITGFAGTILAMPFSSILVTRSVAKPVLNLLGLLSGIYVFAGNKQAVNYKVLKQILLYMICGVVIGIFVIQRFITNEKVLFIILGVFVICLSIQGLYKSTKPTQKRRNLKPIENNILLLCAGIVHGVFVSGGPLLIGYLSNVIEDKKEFRATISTVWIILNGIMFCLDLVNHIYTPALIKIQLIAIPFLFGGMYVGTKLYAKMSQEFFMKLTYVLLFISGISLLVK